MYPDDVNEMEGRTGERWLSMMSLKKIVYRSRLRFMIRKCYPE